MNNKELIATLKHYNACPIAIKWVGKRDLKTAWAECPRLDWMVWGLAKMTWELGWPTHKELISIAVFCARRAYSFVKKDPGNVIINCIEAVEAWVKNPCKERRSRKLKLPPMPSIPPPMPPPMPPMSPMPMYMPPSTTQNTKPFAITSGKQLKFQYKRKREV